MEMKITHYQKGVNKTIDRLVQMCLTPAEAIYLFINKPCTAMELADGNFTPEDCLKILDWLDANRWKFM